MIRQRAEGYDAMRSTRPPFWVIVSAVSSQSNGRDGESTATREQSLRLSDLTGQATKAERATKVRYLVVPRPAPCQRQGRPTRLRVRHGRARSRLLLRAGRFRQPGRRAISAEFHVAQMMRLRPCGLSRLRVWPCAFGNTEPCVLYSMVRYCVSPYRVEWPDKTVIRPLHIKRACSMGL